MFELYYLDCLFSMTSFDFCIRTFCVIWWIMVLVAKRVEEVADRKTLQRTVNTAAKIIGAPLPSILDIFLARCSSKTNSIVKDPTHSLFQLLPSGRREHQSPLRQTAQQLFPPGCESPELKSPRPPSETPCKPLPPETWTPPL